MNREVVVTTGARLHFGFLSCKPTTGREFGGAGLMIDAPGFEIAVRKSKPYSRRDFPISQQRAKELTAVDLQKRGMDAERPQVFVEIRAEVPAHIGLGSGTQLGMALSTALSTLEGEAERSPLELASRVGRGARSEIGIYGFARGGFLVGSGKSHDSEIGTLAARAEFPAEWRMLLITPESKTGPAGASEQANFASLTAMPASMTDRLCRIALMQLLPAVIEARLDLCGDALFEFGTTLGTYFAPQQGGTYACKSMAELIAHLRSMGVRGVGQTSWGPTIFALCAHQQEAEQIATDLKSSERWKSFTFRVAAAKNSPAEVVVRET